MAKNVELVNLDVETNKIIAVTYDGELRSFTRQQLLELLDLAQNVPLKGENRAKGASLASIGNLASRLLSKAQEGDFSLKDQDRLAEAIESFNGIIKKRANSPAYHRLVKLKEFQGLTGRLRDAIDNFINKYPELIRVGSGGSEVVGQRSVKTNVKKAPKTSRKGN